MAGLPVGGVPELLPPAARRRTRTGVEPFVRYLDRRRAVLAVLVRARPESRTIVEITAALERAGMLPPDNKTLADLLANLVRSGRVVRVSRGRFRVGTLSRTTEWRVLNWRLLAERWRAAQAEPPHYLL
jgi:hypothetical protein